MSEDDHAGQHCWAASWPNPVSGPHKKRRYGRGKAGLLRRSWLVRKRIKEQLRAVRPAAGMPGGPAQAGPHTQGANILATQLASQQLLQEAQYRSSFTAYDSQPASARLPNSRRCARLLHALPHVHARASCCRRRPGCCRRSPTVTFTQVSGAGSASASADVCRRRRTPCRRPCGMKQCHRRRQWCAAARCSAFLSQMGARGACTSHGRPAGCWRV